MKNKLYSIQFLRFIAIIFVVYSHSYDRLQHYLHFSDDGFYARMAFLGRSGVDLFFVISGFIMAFITTESVRKDNFNFCLFMKKRCIRIVPMYWIVSFAVLCLLIFKPDFFYNTSTDFSHAIGSFLFFPVASPDNKFAPILGVGWTLNLEMYFYLVLALFICIFKSRYFIYSFVFITLCCIVGYIIGHRESNYLYANLTSSILFEFFFGIVVYKVYLLKRLEPKISLLLVFVCAAFLIFSSYKQWPDELRFIYWGVTYSLIMLSIISFEDVIKFPRVTLIIGDASYTLYPTHYFFIAGIYILLNRYNLLNTTNISILFLVLFCILITCILGVACYFLIEKRITDKLTNKFVKRQYV